MQQRSESESVLLLAAARICSGNRIPICSGIVVAVTSLGYVDNLSRNLHLLLRGQEFVHEEAKQEDQR